VVTLNNVSGQRIDEWRAILDLPDGAQFNVTSVWGATATRLASGDILFEGESWNDVIAAGGSSAFGFIATHSGPLAIGDASFTFI
jgi:hypothetical protein